MEEGEQVEYKKKAAFNMASATLQRIHIGLERIRLIMSFKKSLLKQEALISEVRILFMNMAPLLEEETVKKDSKEVDGLKLKTKRYRGRLVESYDDKLEARLLEIVRKWETELKIYFMPSKKDDDDGDDY